MKAKKIKHNPYQNNQGGLIRAPFTPTNEPSARKENTKGDLRTKKQGK